MAKVIEYKAGWCWYHMPGVWAMVVDFKSKRRFGWEGEIGNAFVAKHGGISDTILEVRPLWPTGSQAVHCTICWRAKPLPVKYVIDEKGDKALPEHIVPGFAQEEPMETVGLAALDKLWAANPHPYPLESVPINPMLIALGIIAVIAIIVIAQKK